MIGLSYKQKCNNFGYHSSEVQSKGNDTIRPQYYYINYVILHSYLGALVLVLWFFIFRRSGFGTQTQTQLFV